MENKLIFGVVFVGVELVFLFVDEVVVLVCFVFELVVLVLGVVEDVFCDFEEVVLLLFEVEDCWVVMFVVFILFGILIEVK